MEEFRYEAALAAALAIIGRLTACPNMPKHERLAYVTFSILDATSRYEEEKGPRRDAISIN